MAMVESRVLAPVIVRRITADPNSTRLPVAPKATPVKPPDKAVSISSKGLLLEQLERQDKSAAVKEADSEKKRDEPAPVDRQPGSDVYEKPRKNTSLNTVPG